MVSVSNKQGKLIPSGILEACVYAEALSSVKSFYHEIMGLELVAEEEDRHLFFRCGQGMFLVFNPGETCSGDPHEDPLEVPPHGATGSGHVAFRIHENEYFAWRARFQDCGVDIEKEISWPHRGKSIFVRDPSGNSVEVATPVLWGLEDT